MKFFLISLLFALLAACALGAAPRKTVVITYPKDIANVDSVLASAKEKIISYGGEILHTFNPDLLKSFIASVPAAALEEVQTLSDEQDHKVIIEEDQPVYAMGGGN